jgi:hypothetical protein
LLSLAAAAGTEILAATHAQDLAAHLSAASLYAVQSHAHLLAAQLLAILAATRNQQGHAISMS